MTPYTHIITRVFCHIQFMKKDREIYEILNSVFILQNFFK